MLLIQEIMEINKLNNYKFIQEILYEIFFIFVISLPIINIKTTILRES